jgi:glycerol kinase
MVFDHSGNEQGKHQLEHEQILPKAGWVEHNPVEIWERHRLGDALAMGQKGLSATTWRACGITNQRETAVVWDRTTGRPYYNAIVWQDTRTDRIASALERDGKATSSAEGRAAAGDVLLGRQGAVDPRERRRRPARRPSAATRLRQHRHPG